MADIEDPQALVTELWESLQRGGGQFGDQAKCDPIEGGYLVLLQLKDHLTLDMRESIRGYVKAFLESRGYQPSGVVFATRYVRFRLRRSLSRAK